MQKMVTELEGAKAQLQGDIKDLQKAMEVLVEQTKEKSEEEKQEIVHNKRQVREAIMESETVRSELSHTQTRLESERARYVECFGHALFWCLLGLPAPACAAAC